MGIFADIAFGNAITKLTNMFEEIVATNSTHFIGAGGGFDSLPKAKQAKYANKIPGWLNSIKKRPRHEVTLLIAKNITLSVRTKRQQRAAAQEKLLNWLIEQGLALDSETFFASYGGDDRPTSISSPIGTGSFEFSPSMPNVEKLAPIDEFTLGHLVLRFFVAPPSYAQLPGGESAIKYSYAAFVFNTTHKSLERVYTVETGLAGGYYFCSFESNGVRQNYGSNDSYRNFGVFRGAVIESFQK